jgi:ketosteroid isomerase-like protein
VAAVRVFGSRSKCPQQVYASRQPPGNFKGAGRQPKGLITFERQRRWPSCSRRTRFFFAQLQRSQLGYPIRPEETSVKIMIVIALNIAAICTLLAQTRPQSSQSHAEIQRTLERIEHAVVASLLKGDASANEQHLADDVVLTMPDGRRVDKKQAIDDVKSGHLKLEKCRLTDLKVRVYGDTAVVTYRTADSGTYRGQRFEGETQWTDTFMRRSAGWQIVAGHGSTTLPAARR